MYRPSTLRRAAIALSGTVLAVAAPMAAVTASPATTGVDNQPQTVSFFSSPPQNAVYDEFSYAVDAKASSGLPVTLSIAPEAASACSLQGSTVLFTGTGTCIVLADQAGDGYWQPAEQASQSFVIAKATPLLGGFTVMKGPFGLTPSTFEANLQRRALIGWTSGPVAGEALTFYVAGQRMCSGTTDRDGNATCTATIGLVNALNESSYTVVYAGTADYNGSKATGELRNGL